MLRMSPGEERPGLRVLDLHAVKTGEGFMSYDIKVNGAVKSVDVDGDTPLLWVLRDVLGMTGTKFGCGMALCGACTVHIDGAPTRSCITTVDSIGTSAITTIEAIGATPAGAKIQKAWLEREVPQCGYCQSGQIMSAAALIGGNPAARPPLRLAPNRREPPDTGPCSLSTKVSPQGSHIAKRPKRTSSRSK